MTTLSPSPSELDDLPRQEIEAAKKDYPMITKTVLDEDKSVALRTIDTLVSEPRGPQVRLDRTYTKFKGDKVQYINRSVDLRDLTTYGAEKVCQLTDAAKRSTVTKRQIRDRLGSLCKEGLVMESRKELVEMIQENLDTI